MQCNARSDAAGGRLAAECRGTRAERGRGVEVRGFLQADVAAMPSANQALTRIIDLV
jgi:hypothetical protein